MVNEEGAELVEESCGGIDILRTGFDGENRNRNDTYSHGILGRAPAGCQSDRSQPDTFRAVQLVRANGVMLQIPLSQDAEKLRQHRSRFVKILNVPHRGYASGFDSPAALLDEFFEHLLRSVPSSETCRP